MNSDSNPGEDYRRLYEQAQAGATRLLTRCSQLAEQLDVLRKRNAFLERELEFMRARRATPED